MGFFSMLLSMSGSFRLTSLKLNLKKLAHPSNTAGLGTLTCMIGRLDDFDARSVNLVTWHHVGNDVPGTKIEASVRIVRSLRKIECRSRPSDHVEVPYPCPFKQVPAEVKVGIWIPHIEPVVSKLSGNRLDIYGSIVQVSP